MGEVPTHSVGVPVRGSKEEKINNIVISLSEHFRWEGNGYGKDNLLELSLL